MSLLDKITPLRHAAFDQGVGYYVQSTQSYPKDRTHADFMLWAFENRSTRAGLGGYHLSLLCDLFDHEQRDLCLFTYNPKLVQYYEKFGFKLRDHEHYTFFMVRRPQWPYLTRHKLYGKIIRASLRWNWFLERLSLKRKTKPYLLRGIRYSVEERLSYPVFKPYRNTRSTS